VIRLIVAAVVCIALHPAAATAHARERGSQRTIGVLAGGERAVVPPVADGHLDGVVGAAGASLAPVVWLVAPVAALDSLRVVARLWLRGQRLLC
jgi:hypothetical protein